MKENIKIGLLGVIALTLITDTFFMKGSETKEIPTVSVTNQPITPPTSPNKPKEVTPPVVTGPTTGISFADNAHDFGSIKQDSDNNHVFTFTNTGTEPLLISNARGSCGCTVPEYPTQPIAPGETGEIKVTYKPGKQKGSQTKTVTITANTEPAQTRLQISANVEEVK